MTLILILVLMLGILVFAPFLAAKTVGLQDIGEAA